MRSLPEIDLSDPHAVLMVLIEVPYLGCIDFAYEHTAIPKCEHPIVEAIAA